MITRQLCLCWKLNIQRHVGRDSHCPYGEEIDFCLSKNATFSGTNSTNPTGGAGNWCKHLPWRYDKVFSKSAALLGSLCHSQGNNQAVCPHPYFTVLVWKSIILGILPVLCDLLFSTQFWNTLLHLSYSILGTSKDFASGFIYSVPVNVVILISLSCHFATNVMYLIRERRERSCVLINYRGLINGLSYLVSKSLTSRWM